MTPKPNLGWGSILLRLSLNLAKLVRMFGAARAS